jgi:hypothetical protein
MLQYVGKEETDKPRTPKADTAPVRKGLLDQGSCIKHSILSHTLSGYLSLAEYWALEVSMRRAIRCELREQF